MMKRSRSGVLLTSRLTMMALTSTDLPEPVVPAMSKCGMLARSAATGVPSTLWPRPMASAASSCSSRKGSDSITSRRLTTAAWALGTSMPT